MFHPIKYGQAICCGEIPKYGRHNFHVYNGIKQGADGYYCEKCEKNSAVIGGGAMFALYHWNRKFNNPIINAPEGYQWGELSFEGFMPYGSSTPMHRKEIRICLFKTDHPKEYLFKSKDGYECAIDEAREIKNLTLLNIYTGEEIKLEIPAIKNKLHSIYLTTSYCSDGAKWTRINMYGYSPKYSQILNNFLALLHPPL